MRRNQVLYHSQAAPHVGQESRVEPCEYGSDSIGERVIRVGQKFDV